MIPEQPGAPGDDPGPERPKGPLGRILETILSWIGCDPRRSGDVIMTGSGEAPLTPVHGTWPQERALHANAGVMAIAKAMGIDLSRGPVGGEYGMDQIVDGCRWHVASIRDRYRPNWIHHEAYCREGASNIRRFGSYDALLSMTIEKMPEAVVAALPGRTLRDVIGTGIEGRDLVVREVENSGSATTLIFGYQAYVPFP